MRPSGPGDDRLDAYTANENWALACRAAALLAVDPAGLGGILLRTPPGDARTAWLALTKNLTLAGRRGPVVQCRRP